MSLVEDVSFGVLDQKYDAAIVYGLRSGVRLKRSSQPQRETFGAFILGKIQVFCLKWALQKSVVAFRKKSISNKSRVRRRGRDPSGCLTQICLTCATVMSAKTIHRKRKQSY